MGNFGFESINAVTGAIGDELNNAQDFMEAFSLAIGGNSMSQTTLTASTSTALKLYAMSTGSLTTASSGNTKIIDLDLTSSSISGVHKSLSGFKFDQMDQLGSIMQANNMQELVKQLISMVSQAGKGIADPVKEAVQQWARS